MTDDAPDTDPRGGLPEKRNSTGSAEELSDLIRNAVDDAVGPAVSRAFRPFVEGVVEHSTRIERMELRATRTDVRLTVVEATRIILPSALAGGALLLSALNTALILWMHAR